MNWAVIQAGLLAWFASALGVDDDGIAVPAQWEDEPEAQPPNGLQGFLKIRSVDVVGRDETRYELFTDDVMVDMTSHELTADESYTPGVSAPTDVIVSSEVDTIFSVEQGVADSLIPTTVGNRRLTVSFIVEAHNLQPSWSSHRFLDRVRAKLALPSATATLAALGLGLLGVEAIQVVDGEVDGRRLGRATLDVHFSATSCVADSDAPVSWIETVGLTTHLQNVDGTELPAPPNLVDETVPS